MRFARLLFLVMLALTASCTGVSQRRPAEASFVEHNLRPRVVVDGEAPIAWDIHERMRRYRVPTLSIAVIRHGELAWSARYTMDGGATYPAGEERFQAASLSKGVTGILAATLAVNGQLNLDEPIDRCLLPLVLPLGKQSEVHPVTLRGLLHHTAGATVNGFDGYPQGARIPTDTEVVLGKTPANSPAVTIATEPGSRYAYSGGGYTLAQIAIEHCAGAPFAELMQHNLLAPAAMTLSTFQQPLPAGLPHAIGHERSGFAVPGGANTYPELAAAGLWTTSTDLAKLLIAVRNAETGGPSFLPAAAAHEVLTPGLNNYGFGVFVSGTGAHRRFMHSGGNRGFKSSYVMYLDSGDGVVIMTDGDNGPFLGGEVTKAVAATYNWPDFEPHLAKRQPIDAAAMHDRLGRYAIPASDDRATQYVDLIEEGGAWFIDRADLGRIALVPTGPLSFVAPETGDTLAWDAHDTGLVRIGDHEARRAKLDKGTH